MFTCIFIHTLLTMDICMQDDSAVLYALLQLRGEAKLEKNFYEAFVLVAYGFWQVINRVTKL